MSSKTLRTHRKLHSFINNLFLHGLKYIIETEYKLGGGVVETKKMNVKKNKGGQWETILGADREYHGIGRY